MFENRIVSALEEVGVNVYTRRNMMMRSRDIVVNDPSVFRRIVFEGSIGAGDSYMEKLWDCLDIGAMMECVIKGGLPEQFQGPKDWFTQWLFSHFNLQLGRGHHVAEHYNFGNDYYQRVLGSSMVYTCPYWTAPNQTLEQAQFNKNDLIARKLGFKRGKRLLDIGCGWGEALIHAALYYGVEGVGITLSKEQAEYARARVQLLGLPIKIILWDAFEIDQKFAEGEFDYIISVGMAEHVGEKNFPLYFKQYKHALAKDGIALCHAIVGDKGGADPWLHKHIFKNGWIPQAAKFQDSMEAEGLAVLDLHEFESSHYARGLRCWRENQDRHEAELLGLGYTEEQLRMNRYYFGVCEGGFRSNEMHVNQYVLCHKEAANDNLFKGYEPVRLEMAA